MESKENIKTTAVKPAATNRTSKKKQIQRIVSLELQEKCKFLLSEACVGYPDALTSCIQLESMYAFHYQNRPSDYIHCIKNLIQALKVYGVKNYKPDWLKRNWDAEAIAMYHEKKLTGATGVNQQQQQHRKDGHNYDPTKQPIEDVYKLLGLDGISRIAQCRKCKSWAVEWMQCKTNSSDEQIKVNAMCTKCMKTFRF